MTNEEWMEELYNLVADMGMFHEMHPKIDELKVKHKDLSITEVVELAYAELKRKYEEKINNQEIIKKSYINYAINEITDNTMTQGEFHKKIVTDKKFREQYLHE